MRFAMDELGIDSYHGKDFYHELPLGFRSWSFIYVVLPQRINYEGGMIDAPAGTCILYPPNSPRYLRCVDGADSFANTWMHFYVDDEAAFRQLLADYELPICGLFMLSQDSPVFDTMRDLVYECSTEHPHAEDIISSLIQVLLVQLSRGKRPFGTQLDNPTYQRQARFEALRKEMYNAPEKEWKVTDMAARLFLSTNQFISLYSHFFGITPKQDLLNARITKAKGLLGRSSVMREVAVNCGFQNEFYFSRIFKEKTGKTPGEFIKGMRVYNTSPD